MPDEPMAPVSRDYIANRIRELGYDSLTSFLASRPDASYLRLGEELDTVPLHIYILQFEEAKISGQIRAAVMDSYVRQINRYFPDGWKLGEDFEFKRVSALTLPTSDAIAVARLDYLSPQLENVEELLANSNIPEGWRPRSINDPIIVDAFVRGWPEE